VASDGGRSRWRRLLHELRLMLIALRVEVADAFRQHFGRFRGIEVLCSRWENAPPHDCFVTAGNSFGLMSAGIDAAVVREFGPDIERTVQTRIMNEYLGEQPIGTAFLLETGNQRVRWLCHAPTMRVPDSIAGTDYVYLATRAALLAIYHHNRVSDERIETVAFPAMGAGFGGLAPDEVARQMAAAYQLYLEPPYPPNWDRVVQRERTICYAGDEKRVNR
jgi:O-acetyl-ADP-ribose deacetylase (regulator of RNase III)